MNFFEFVLAVIVIGTISSIVTATRSSGCGEPILVPASSGAGLKSPGVKAFGHVRLNGRRFTEGFRCDQLGK
jgi:hypothetical protein